MSKTTLHLPADAPGARGVQTANHGAVLLEPGEVREDLDLSGDELDLAKGNGLKTGKPKSSEPETDASVELKAFAKMNRAELDAAVEAAKPNGFTLPADADTNAKIAAALQAHADKKD